MRELKQNFDTMKMNYMDLKNQYELVNIKFQNVGDENFNIKRDLIMYEKEIKSKNDIIEKLKHELLDLGRRSFGEKSETGRNSMNSNFQQEHREYMNMSNMNNNNTNMKNSNEMKMYSPETTMYTNNNNSRRNVSTNETKSMNNSLLYDRNDKLDNSIISTNSTKSSVLDRNSIRGETKSTSTGGKINVLPSQKNIFIKEGKILEIETKLYSLQQERDKVYNIIISDTIRTI